MLRKSNGQVAIFVIIALVIIGVIALLFVFRLKPAVDERFDPANPEAFMRSCIKDKTLDTVQLMLKHGGLLKFEKNITYNKKDVPYLCYSSGNYNSCINQHPSLLEEAEMQLLEEIKPEVQNCFSQLKIELEKRNKKIEGEIVETKLSLSPNAVQIDLTGPISISDVSGNERYNEFSFDFASSLYNLISVAQDMVKQESLGCYFEYVGYMAVYPRFEISKDTLSDGTKIYLIKDIQFNERMEVAIRGCAIPPGI